MLESSNVSEPVLELFSFTYEPLGIFKQLLPTIPPATDVGEPDAVGATTLPTTTFSVGDVSNGI